MEKYDQFVSIEGNPKAPLRSGSTMPALMLELVRRVHQPNFAIQSVAEYFRAVSAVLWFKNKQTVDEFRVHALYNRPDLEPDVEQATFSASDESIVVSECFKRRAMRAGIAGTAPFDDQWLQKPYTRGITSLGIWGLLVCPVIDGGGEPLGVVTLYFRKPYDAPFVFQRLPIVAQFISHTVSFMVSELDEAVIERRKMGHEIQAAVKSARSSLDSISPAFKLLYKDDEFKLTQLDDISKSLNAISQSAGQFRFSDSIRDQRKHAVYLSIREEFNSVAYPQNRLRKDKFLTLSRIFIDGRQCELLMARVHLRQLVDNLLGNAIKYSSKRGIVRSRVDRAVGGAATFRVANTNEGLQKHEWQKIWRQGFRGRNAKLSDEVGEGLGLSIVREICEVYDIGYSYFEEDQASFHWSVVELKFPSEIVRWQ